MVSLQEDRFGANIFHFNFTLMTPSASFFCRSILFITASGSMDFAYSTCLQSMKSTRFFIPIFFEATMVRFLVLLSMLTSTKWSGLLSEINLAKSRFPSLLLSSNVNSYDFTSASYIVKLRFKRRSNRLSHSAFSEKRN